MQSAASRLRELLRQRGAATATTATMAQRDVDGRGSRRGRRAHARHDAMYVVGERMTPRGCECCVMQPHRTTMTTTTTRERRARVVLRDGVLPGMVVRTRGGDCYDALLRHGVLPDEAWRRGVVLRRAAQPPSRDTSTNESDASAVATTRSTFARLPPPACATAACGRCVRCPWLATAAAMTRHAPSSSSLSTLHKAAVLRACVAAALRAHDNNKNNNNKCNNSSVSCTFREPYAVPTRVHQLQEVVYPFVRRQRSSSSSGGDYFAFSAATAVADDTNNNNNSNNDNDNAAVSGDDDDDVACALTTLEQQRLRRALTRWARQLPPPLRAALRAAFVLQPTHADATRPWHSDVVVCVCLQRDTSLTWRREAASPLSSTTTSNSSSSSSSADDASTMLSREEQQLVDAVHAAAPLPPRLHVHVCFVDGGWQSLYPRIVRHGVLHDLRMHYHHHNYNNNKNNTTSADDATTAATMSSHMPVRTCVCYCAPLSCSLTVTMPACASLLLWGAYSAAAAASSSSSLHATTGDVVQALPLPFWRQCHALETTASLLLSLLLQQSQQQLATSCACDVYVHSPPLRRDGDRNAAMTTTTTTSARSSTCVRDEGVADAHGGACELAALLRGAVAQAAAVAHRSSVRVLSSLHDVGTTTTTTAAVEASHASSSSSSRTLAVLAHVTDAAVDATALQALLRQARACRTCSNNNSDDAASRAYAAVRVVLWQCSASMRLAALQETLTALLATHTDAPCRDNNDDSSSARCAVRVAAGVVDVDELASSLVAYAVVDVTW